MIVDMLPMPIRVCRGYGPTFEEPESRSLDSWELHKSPARLDLRSQILNTARNKIHHPQPQH